MVVLLGTTSRPHLCGYNEGKSPKGNVQSYCQSSGKVRNTGGHKGRKFESLECGLSLEEWETLTLPRSCYFWLGLRILVIRVMSAGLKKQSLALEDRLATRKGESLKSGMWQQYWWDGRHHREDTLKMGLLGDTCTSKQVSTQYCLMLFVSLVI